MSKGRDGERARGWVSERQSQFWRSTKNERSKFISGSEREKERADEIASDESKEWNNLCKWSWKSSVFAAWHLNSNSFEALDVSVVLANLVVTTSVTKVLKGMIMDTISFLPALIWCQRHGEQIYTLCFVLNASQMHWGIIRRINEKWSCPGIASILRGKATKLSCRYNNYGKCTYI